jgi:hypothetical protein
MIRLGKKVVIKMCQDLDEYDPFEPLYIYSGNPYDEDVELFDEPMSEEDWEEWLNNEYIPNSRPS